MNINIRLETPQDYREIEILTREAFWGFTHPTCDEHYLIHKLRKVPAFVPELDFIAEVDGVLAGNIMYSKAKIISEDKVETEVLTFGPLSVLPKYWRCGLGTALMKHSIKEAIKLGYRAIVFYGHPDYYPRFGFRNAEAFGIKAPNGSNFDALMAMELYDGALNKITGTIIEDPVFYFEAEEADKYNELFPPKEPAYMIPIDILFDKIPNDAKQAFVERDIKTLAWLNRLSGREMLRWKGIDEEIINTINEILNEYGYAKKLLPSSYIFCLANMGLRVPDVTKIRTKKGISVYRVSSEGNNYILKVYDNREDTREIENYKILNKLNIKSLPLIKYTENSILLPDVDFCENIRMGCEKDLTDIDIARSAAVWYKELHTKGYIYVNESGGNLYDETDFITLSNLENIAFKTKTENEKIWIFIKKHFEQIKRKINELKKTLTYNDFYYTNLIAAKDKSYVFMLDFNLLGKGYAYSDIRNVLSSFSEEAKEMFFETYGIENINENEKAADLVLSPLVTLSYACKNNTFPAWAEKPLYELKNGILYDNLISWFDSF